MKTETKKFRIQKKLHVEVYGIKLTHWRVSSLQFSFYSFSEPILIKTKLKFKKQFEN
jgi:hypothetical protein